MGFGSFIKDVGSGIADGIRDTAKALNYIDRLGGLNPLHQEPGSASDADKQKYNGPIGNALNHQVETASRGMTWLYDNGISQPISTALMAGMLPGGPGSAHNWATAWHAANHISPAQALFLDKGQTERAVNSPLTYYKPNSAQLPPGFDLLPEEQQQDLLRKAGMPATGNAYIQELRESSAFYKNATGIGDFALRWWGDPTVIAGSNLGKVRAARQVAARPQEGLGVVARPGKKIPIGIGKVPGGGSAGDINKIMDSSGMTRAQDFIWQNRENPALLNNLSMARNSAMGPRFGAIAALLKTPDEIHDFLRVGLGDVDAIERLQTKNALAASRIEQETSRVAQLDLMATRYTEAGTGRGAQYAALARQAMRDGDARINADESLVQRYGQVLDHAHELDQVNLTKWSFAKAQDATAAQAAYRARAARGGKAGRQATVQPTPFLSKGTATPVDLGFQKSRLYGVGDFFSTPVTVVRAFGNARPNGFMRIDDIDRDSIAELRGQLARIPGITDQTRLNMLNEYLKTTTEGERLALLKQIGATGAAKVAEKHGLDAEAGLDIYKTHLSRQAGEIDNMKRYSAAKGEVTLPDGSLANIHVDEFATDGGKLVLHPNLVTRLANDHVFQDLDQMDKVLARHSSAFRALRTAKLGNPDWVMDGMDYMTHLFKFGTLFRLGYIPRVAGDDLAGQVARLGAASMAMRIGWGVRNSATNLALWRARPMAAAEAATAQEGVAFAKEEMAKLQPQIDRLSSSIANSRAATQADLTQAGRRLAKAKAKRAAMDPMTPAAKVAAMDQLIAKHELAAARNARSMGTGVAFRNMKLADLKAHHGWLDRQRQAQQQVVDDATARASAPKVTQATRPVNLPGGAVAPGAFQGQEGEYYQKMISSDDTIGQIFMTNKRLVHGHLMRSFGHGGKAVSAAQDEALHATSWAHAINAQLIQDPLALQAIKGADVTTMTKWLTKTAEGRQYMRRLGMDPSARGVGVGNRIIRDPEDIAQRAKADVDEYMPTPEIRQKALEPGGVDADFLKEVPMAARPDVHTGQVGQTQGRYQRALDEVIGRFYKVAASLPADRWSRHPLFNQLYEGHMKTLADQLAKQGAYDRTVAGVEQMATTARRLALRDTRKLVFDIAHRSDAAAALRIISPFMAATTESFQRWGRIIADRPQTVGYAANFYNSGLGIGSMQDADGNHIARSGYSYTIDPKTGKAVKRLVPKSERYIVGRMPKWLAHSPIGVAFGVEPASGDFKLSQNSMNLVTQGDPWFNPGVGPIVQIPVNQFVKDKPKAAEVARHLGVLPFGPQNGGLFGSGPAGEAAGFFMPATVKNFLTAYDTSDERYQQVKLQIMQRAAFEHDQLGKPMPSAKQIADMTKHYWIFSAASAFLQPMATQKKDAYQFYRDQYNALRRQDPMSADDQFLQRYGESYFIFAQSQSRNESGIPATTKAVELEKKYGDLIAQNPELGALIIGPEGNGPFSPEAYSYQLNHPVTPGSAEMQRTKMSADDAMKENQRRLGWSKYTTVMNDLNARLRNRGLSSFGDKGAEDLKTVRGAITAMWSQPLLPTGEKNAHYNDAWSKDFSTYDTLKYDRLIPSLQAVASSPLAEDPNRSDLRSLKTYLLGRTAVSRLLQQRAAAGGAKTLTAKSNGDLANSWQRFVDGLIEQDTRFGDLHSRYLSRDLNYDNSQQLEDA
jgi:hypothetical protein